MRVIFSTLLIAVVLSSCNNSKSSTSDTVYSDAGMEITATAAVDAENAPVFKFEKEAFDFGEIREGDVVSHEFRFTNTGKSPLIISSASATCGCTVPEYPKEPIPPGGEGLIKVVYNSANNSGMQNKVVTLTANTAPEIKTLTIVGNVLAKK